ncbi:MAG: lysophospholipid acyltransferase family protein [Armatimonadetes bacterium]|nr:lysophospholipid acyltransferase family protein [Armatimonadota bacterium]
MKLRDYFWSKGQPWRGIRSYTVPRLLRLLHAGLMSTIRLSTTGVHHMRPFFEKTEGPGALFVLWHDHTLVPLHLFRGRDICVMMSTSRAGRMQAAFWNLNGWRIVWGSSKKKEGITAVREVLRLVREGVNCGFTPDGPKGPRHQAHGGVVYLASKAPAVVLPIAVAASDEWRLSTWDKYLIPKPFSRVHVNVGEPLHVPAELSREENEMWRGKIEAALNESHRQAQEEIKKRE